MSEDLRRLEGGKFFLDVGKYILTVAAVSSLISERINLRIGVTGLLAGAAVALIGFWVLPPKKPKSRLE